MSRGNIFQNINFKIFGEIIGSDQKKYFVNLLTVILLINEMILKPKMGLTLDSIFISTRR